MMMVELLGSGSQIRRYTPVYQCPNVGVLARGDSDDYRRPYCIIIFELQPIICQYGVDSEAAKP